MTHPQHPPNIEISDDHAAQFIQSLRNTIEAMTRTQREEVRLIAKNRQAVAISIDGKNKPFLGYSAGYNKPDSRTALPIDDAVLYEIRKWLLVRRKTGPMGGRVFLTSRQVFTVPVSEPIVLVEWEWPRIDLVEEVLYMLDESLYW